MSRFVGAALFIALTAGCATIDAGGGTTAPENVSKTERPEAPSTPVFETADLEGKSVADIDSLLGAPDLTRVEGAGEFRRYTLAECALLIILYPDPSGVKRAAEIEASALKSGEPKPDLDRCLAVGKPKIS